MKKFLFLLFAFLTVHPVVPAQDYRNIINAGVAFYSGTVTQPGYLSGVKTDSLLPGGNGDTLFLAANTMRPMTPPGALLDTVGGILGRRIEKLSGGWFRFYTATGDTILLNTAALLNDTWKFITLPQDGRLMATCTAIQPETFLGVTDTVKTFTFQAKDSAGMNIPDYFNGKTIRLSRQYGFTQVYDLYRLPASTGLFTLEGRTVPPAGFQGLTWHDVYDYNVGDVFHILKHENYQLTSQHYTTDHKYIRTIKSKQVNPPGSTVTYVYDYCDEETYFSFSSGYVTSYFSGTTQETYPYTYAPASGSGTFVPEPFDRNGYRFYSTLQHFVPGMPSCGQNINYYLCCWKPNPTYNQYIREQEYARGLGKVHDQQWTTYNWQVYYNYENLVYYKKGNQQWGAPFYPDCATMNPTFSVSPSSLSLNYPAGSNGIMHIYTNGFWSIAFPAGSSRFTFSPDSGQGDAVVTVTAKDSNMTTHAIVEEIMINNPKVVKSYSVSQLADPTPRVLFYPDTLVLGWQTGSRDTLFILANIWWALDFNGGPPPDWVAFDRLSGSGDGSVVFFANTQNNGTVSRATPMQLKNTAGSKDIFLMQKARYGLGIDNSGTLRLSISPNPLNSSATVRITGLPENAVKQVALYDFTGTKVFSDSFVSDTYLFRRGNLPPGMYLFRVACGTDRPGFALKVIIQ